MFNGGVPNPKHRTIRYFQARTLSLTRRQLQSKSAGKEMSNPKPTHWADIQQNIFTRWVNEHLKQRGMMIEDMGKDFQDGLRLVALLEIISSKQIKHNRHPIVPFQKLENCQNSITFVTNEGIKLVNISGDDIAYGRLKLILGLIWTLILRYQINKGDGQAKEELLNWVRSKIPEYNIQNMTKDWNDGRALCALVDALKPGSCPNHKQLDQNQKEQNCKKGIDLGYDVLGVPKIILPDELANPKSDEHGNMTYISYYRDLERWKLNDASKCRAFGPGLVEGIRGEPAPFTVINPSKKGKIEIKVEGPKDNAKVEVTKRSDDTWDVQYHPTEPGNYKVHVTLDGIHIPGSIFHVTVLDALSLGGEGKIRIFYSTTTATNEKSRPLQELLEKKKVHLRPDFEPWIPVDILEKEDREKVFKKAGTRKLPIVYIDDNFIGDADKIFELEKSGALDRLLNFRS